MIRSVSALSVFLALTLAPSSSSGQSSGTASDIAATPTLDSCTALARKSLHSNAIPPGLSPAAVEERLRQAFLRIRDAKDVEAMLACIMRRSR
jgi:hypothetical protein